MKAVIKLLLLLSLAGCDKPESTTGSTNGQTAKVSATAAAAADSVEDLLAKLPEKAPRDAPPADVQVFGKFGTRAAMPSPAGEREVNADPKAVAELNIVAKFRIESAFAERTVSPGESIIVQLGGEETDGLLLTIRYGGKSASRKVVPADNGPELVSNLDHTVERVLNELGVPRKVSPR